MEDKEHALEKVLKQLNNKQMAHFMWISVARAVPFHTKNYLKNVNENGYLTPQFLSIEICRVLCMFENAAPDNVLASASKLISDLNPISHLSIGSNIDSAIDNAIVRALELALHPNDAHGLISRQDAGYYTICLNRSYDLDYINNIDRCLKDMGHLGYFDLLAEDVALIYENRYHELNNDTSCYGEVWEEWLDTLRLLGGGYWADWYLRLLKNRFKIADFREIDVDEIKRHLSLPRELWVRELGVSAQWLMKLKKPGAKHLNEARIILLGEKGAGKTSLARRLIDPKAPMPAIEESTEGVGITNVKLSDMAEGISSEKDANVHIWDFAGHAITHAVHRFFLSERCLYIIVYDGRTEGRNRLSYWLDHVSNYGGKSRVIVLVNLQDEHSPDIAETYFRERYTNHQCEFIRFSIKDDAEKLQHFREKLAGIIAADPAWNQKIPADYFEVKQKIEKAFAKEHRNHISRQEFDKIAANIAETEKKGLLKSLTYLGVCLWYPEIEGIDLLVLNPEWITRGIYRIINWLKESGRADASIALIEFRQVFREIKNDYPQDKHPFLYQLMQNYELAYKKAYCEEIVVPQCLPEDSPARAELPDFPLEASLYVEITANKSGNEGPRLTFPYDVLPRFIVRRSDDLKGCPIWRYGAVLKKGSVTALIEQEEYLIKLHAKGNDSRDFLGELLYTLMAVLNDYPSFASEKPEVSCCIAGSGGSSEMIPLTQVINYVQYMEKENKNSYFDPGRKMEIPLDNAREYLSPQINNYLIFADQANIAQNGSVTARQNN